MNEILIDVTGVPEAAVGDKVTLIGPDGNENITAEELAAGARVPPHAVLAGIGPRVARDYTS
jgi:alanine racemase